MKSMIEVTLPDGTEILASGPLATEFILAGIHQVAPSTRSGDRKILVSRAIHDSIQGRIEMGRADGLELMSMISGVLLKD